MLAIDTKCLSVEYRQQLKSYFLKISLFKIWADDSW